MGDGKWSEMITGRCPFALTMLTTTVEVFAFTPRNRGGGAQAFQRVHAFNQR